MGTSSSSSTSKTAQRYSDKRVVASGGGVGISGNSNSVTVVNKTGGVAVAKASLNFAQSAQDTAAKSVSQALGFAGQVTKSDMAFLSSVQAQNAQIVQGANQAVAAAYQDAQTNNTTANHNSEVIILAAIGAVAVVAFARGR